MTSKATEGVQGTILALLSSWISKTYHKRLTSAIREYSTAKTTYNVVL